MAQNLSYGNLPVWGMLVTQLPLPVWFLTVITWARRRQWARTLESRDGQPFTSFLWLKRYSVLKDVIILLVPMFAVIANDIRDDGGTFVGFRVMLLWLITVVCDHLTDRTSFWKEFSWNVVDLMCVAMACWSFTEVLAFIAYDSDNQTWSLDPPTSLYLISHSRQIIFPFSVLAFLIFLRNLRFLHIFPSISVPWQTFSHSFQEVVSYLFVFLVVILAFSTLYMINFGGELEEYSGLGAGKYSGLRVEEE